MHCRAALVALVLGATGVLVWARYPAAAVPSDTPRAAGVSLVRGAAAGPDGRTLWLRDCAVCHRADASGSDRGPDLRSVGGAMVDFMVSTGRMPIASPDERPRRHRVAYSAAQSRALVAYASTLVQGPGVPRVDLETADLAHGGAVFRSQCAACHQAAGGGGALAHGAEAPPLLSATPTQVVEALRTGPGTMPAFDQRTISRQEAADVAAYVRYLHHPQDRGGLDLGHLGPVPEGLVAWGVGLAALLLITRLLGSRSPGRP